MAIVVCCPCGNPLDCDDLDIVVSLACPKCGQEILIELEGTVARRATLTIMDGPHWIGERFVIPVNVALSVGAAPGNWLSLESEQLSPTHCRMHLSPDGRLVVEDEQGSSGIWIEEQRVAKGRLLPLQSLRIGDFRFRFDLVSPDGKTPFSGSRVSSNQTGDALPPIDRVSRMETPGRWLLHHRFFVARTLTTSAAWLLGLYHFCVFPRNPLDRWAWLGPCLWGVAITIILQAASRRITLVQRHSKFLSIGALAVLMILDAHWGFQGVTWALLLLMGALVLLVAGTPHQSRVLVAAVLGLTSLITLLVATLQGIPRLFV